MINSAAARTISELFNPEKDVTYFIPKYQREYVWGKNNWELLFDDIVSNDNDHFMGSIICINTKTDAVDKDNLELIDGQQRMTTLSILFMAIYDHLSSFKASIEDEEELSEFTSELLNLKYKLILKSDKKSLRLTPSVSGKNKQDYEHLFSFESRIMEGKFAKSPNAGLRRLVKAFRYFQTRLQEQRKVNDTEFEPIFDRKETLDLLKKLNSAVLVKIEVVSHSDAFTLFETLNNRGVPLTAIDLIKNSFLNEFEKRQKDSIDEKFENWNRLISNLTDDYNVQERFLRHFYHAYKNEADIEVKGKTRATGSTLIGIYDTLIKKDPEHLFKRLNGSSEVYNKLVVYENEENSETVTKKLKDLQNIGGVSSYALLLYVFEKYDLMDSEKTQLIEFFVKFFLRRNITDSPPTRDLDSIFIEIIKNLHLGKQYNFEQIKNSILNHSAYASDELVIQKLKGKVYEENVGATRFMLCKIEELNNTSKETITDLWARDNKKNFIWTIEHIFPQGNNIPTDWVQMIADGDLKLAKEIQESYVHTLGNLTLTGYNSQLSNFSFDKKRERMNSEKTYIGYKNGMYLNNELKDKMEWRVNDIEKRGNFLVNEVLSYLKIKD